MSLATALDRLGALDPWWTTVVGAPEDEGWWRLDELDVAPWVDALAAANGDRRDVASSYLGAWLGGAVVAVPVTLAVLAVPLPLPGPPARVRRHDDGWFDGVAYDSDTPTGTRADLPDVLAAAAAVLEPHLESIRARTPFGRRGLWSSVGDEIASIALWAAREARIDLGQAWSVVEEAIDALATHAPCALNRPRPFPVATTMYSVRGTCCLYFKSGRPDAEECTTCPRRDDESRRRRLLEL